MVEDSTYRYKPLSIYDYHIRLLEILPGRDADRIDLRISHARLSDASGTYDAVSYMWGPPQPTYQVWIDGQFLVICENLWRFLKHHRKSQAAGRISLLWTDSICINQGDLNEKGSQVQGMDKVYSHAQRVLIWLGEVSETQRLTQQDIDFAFDVHRNQLGHDYLTARSLFSEQDEFSEKEKESAERLCACALDVVNHQYWLRLWIVQEIILAKGNAYVIHGSLLLDSEFFGIMRNVDESGEDCTGDAFVSFSELTRNSKAGPEAADFTDACLTSLLTRFNKQLCENLRDRIYGMLGLIDPVLPAARICVDYETNIWVLFLQTLDLLLEERYKPGLDADVSIISQLNLAAQTFNLQEQNIMKSLVETSQLYSKPSLHFPVASSEFREWSDSGRLGGPLLEILSQCKLILRLSSTNCHLLEVSGTTLSSKQRYRLVVNHAKKPGSPRVISRPRLMDHLQPFVTLRRVNWVFALDKELSLGLRFFARGKVHVLGYVDALEGSENLYKLTGLPTDLQIMLQNLVNDCMPLKSNDSLKKMTVKISLSVLMLMRLVFRQALGSV